VAGGDGGYAGVAEVENQGDSLVESRSCGEGREGHEDRRSVNLYRLGNLPEWLSCRVYGVCRANLMKEGMRSNRNSFHVDTVHYFVVEGGI